MGVHVCVYVRERGFASCFQAKLDTQTDKLTNRLTNLYTPFINSLASSREYREIKGRKSWRSYYVSELISVVKRLCQILPNISRTFIQGWYVWKPIINQHPQSTYKGTTNICYPSNPTPKVFPRVCGGGREEGSTPINPKIPPYNKTPNPQIHLCWCNFRLVLLPAPLHQNFSAGKHWHLRKHSAKRVEAVDVSSM